jgi:hypothetical protein
MEAAMELHIRDVSKTYSNGVAISVYVLVAILCKA